LRRSALRFGENRKSAKRRRNIPLPPDPSGSGRLLHSLETQDQSGAIAFANGSYTTVTDTTKADILL
jgi:hypothetical protein